MRRAWLLLVCFLPVLASGQTTEEPRLRLSEIVADPLTDWNDDGKLTPSDEYVELVNLGLGVVDLTGWRLLQNDSSPSSTDLAGTIEPGGILAWINPTGDLNLNGHVALIRPDGRVEDEVRFGSWPGATTASPDARNETDESLSWVDDGWRRWHATPGRPNPEPRWVVSTQWSPTPVDGWWSPNATATLSARPIHAATSVTTVRLTRTLADETTTIASVPSGQPVQALAADGEWSWRIDGTPWAASIATLRVDREAPTFDHPAGHVWIGPERPWRPVLHDAGVGATEFEWRSGDGATSGWTTNLTADALPNGTIAATLRARDRVGNIGEWSPAFSLALDRAPPPAPVVEIEPGQTLSWSIGNDAGSPIALWEVRRIHATGQMWDLPGNTTRLTDAFDPGRTALAYEALGVDAAGNRGNVTRIDVDHAGLYPRVLGIRVSKAFWSTGVEELRVDFDRRMNTTRPPLIELEARIIDQGRWLSNATTFFLSLPTSEDWKEGTQTLRVLNASASDGPWLRTPATATFVVDRSDPTLTTEPGTGWTNSDRVTINLSDASPTSTTWRLWKEGDAEPSAWNGTEPGSFSVPLPTVGSWTVKATAKDAAGNSATKRWGFDVDRRRPLMEARAEGGRIIVRVEDPESGVDWRTLSSDVPLGWDVRPDPSRRRIVIEGGSSAFDGEARLEVLDRAGNQATLNVTLRAPSLPAPSASTRSAEDDAATRLAARLDAEAMEAVAETSNAGPWWIAGLLGSSALSIPIVRRARRRKKPSPSFAKRIRAARTARSGS